MFGVVTKKIVGWGRRYMHTQAEMLMWSWWRINVNMMFGSVPMVISRWQIAGLSQLVIIYNSTIN